MADQDDGRDLSELLAKITRVFDEDRELFLSGLRPPATERRVFGWPPRPVGPRRPVETVWNPLLCDRPPGA